MRKRNSLLCLISIVALFLPIAAHSQTDPLSELDWEFGPTEPVSNDLLFLFGLHFLLMECLP